MGVRILSLYFWVLFLTGEGDNPDKIRLRDIEALSLYQNRMTNARRVSAVPQLKCVGGSAGCHAFVPQVVQCFNRGSDGYDVQWECKADMDNSYRFGQITVGCEGFDYPDDPFVLRGSCGLEYTVELTEEGRHQQTGQQQHYHRDSGYHQGSYGSSWSKLTQSTWLGDLVTMGIVVVVGYIMFKACCGHRGNDVEGYQTGSDSTSPPPPYTESPDNQGSTPHPPGFKPEYTSNSANADSNYNPTSNVGSGGGSGGGGGFWTGAATGGLLGYLFGSNRGSGYGYDYRRGQGYGSGYGGFGSGYGGFGSGYGGFGSGYGGFGRRGWGSGFGSGWTGGSGSGGRSWGGSSRSSGSSGSRTASGFGGTSRR